MKGQFGCCFSFLLESSSQFITSNRIIFRLHDHHCYTHLTFFDMRDILVSCTPKRCAVLATIQITKNILAVFSPHHFIFTVSLHHPSADIYYTFHRLKIKKIIAQR